jgi:MFS family permease
LGTPLLAKLSDRFGPRTIYIISISLFAAGSLMLIIADTVIVLFAGRALQGFGAGGIFPVATWGLQAGTAQTQTQTNTKATATP